MKVKELLKFLKGCNPDANVVVCEYDGCEDAARLVTRTPKFYGNNPLLSERARKKLTQKDEVILLTAMDRGL